MQKKKRKTINELFSIPEVNKIGIYAIYNKKLDKVYIGSSTNVYTRMKQHAANIKRYGGVNKSMILDQIKSSDLEFSVIKTFEDGEITEKTLRKEEQKYIDLFRKHCGDRALYNNAKAFALGNGNKKLYCSDMIIVQLKIPRFAAEKIKKITNGDKSINGYCTEAIIEKLCKDLNI